MRYIIANWKMNMTSQKVTSWLREFETYITETSNTTIIVAPSFIHIPLVKIFLDKYKNVKFSAQDISAHPLGAHTGEVGVEQIKDFCGYSIVGHSELQETEEIKKNKAKLCIENQITPILCSKTPKVEWQNTSTKHFLAWEDPTNISKNGVYNEKPITEIEETINNLVEKHGHSNVIYGGSVNENNSLNLARIKNLTGVLVGNASLNPKNFWKIVQDFNNN